MTQPRFQVTRGGPRDWVIRDTLIPKGKLGHLVGGYATREQAREVVAEYERRLGIVRKERG